MVMSERKWYGSAQHFRTEKSYAEYKAGLKRKKSPMRTKGIFKI